MNGEGRRARNGARPADLADSTAHDHGAESDRGATATEYAILVAFIALIIVLGVTFFGSNLNDWFHRLGGIVGSYVD
jgi:pilus assembly protein Flp/PilA